MFLNLLDHTKHMVHAKCASVCMLLKDFEWKFKMTLKLKALKFYLVRCNCSDKEWLLHIFLWLHFGGLWGHRGVLTLQHQEPWCEKQKRAVSVHFLVLLLPFLNLCFTLHSAPYKKALMPLNRRLRGTARLLFHIGSYDIALYCSVTGWERDTGDGWQCWWISNYARSAFSTSF